MKLKKTLALIMTAAITIGTMAGCSQTTLNYSKELANTSKWGAITSTLEGKVNVDAQGQKEEVTFTATGYSTKEQAYLDMKFNNTSGKVKIPEMQIYVDGMTTYINKSFYEGLYTMTGQASPTGLANIKEDFIALENPQTKGMDVNKIKALASQPDVMLQLGKMFFGENNDLDLPFVQNGREYTLKLNANESVDLGAKALKAYVNNMENLSNTLGLGLKSENIAPIKAAVNDAKFDQALPQIKELLAGSTINSKEVFTDNSYKSDVNVNLQVKGFGTVSMEVKSTSTKSEVKAITFPTSKIKLSPEEFVKLTTPTTTEIAAAKNVVAK
jgi:uncharacterized protein YxeA